MWTLFTWNNIRLIRSYFENFYYSLSIITLTWHLPNAIVEVVIRSRVWGWSDTRPMRNKGKMFPRFSLFRVNIWFKKKRDRYLRRRMTDELYMDPARILGPRTFYIFGTPGCVMNTKYSHFYWLPLCFLCNYVWYVPYVRFKMPSSLISNLLSLHLPGPPFWNPVKCTFRHKVTQNNPPVLNRFLPISVFLSGHLLCAFFNTS